MKLEFGNPQHIALAKKKKTGQCWADTIGKSPTPYKCKDCRFVIANELANTYYKCSKHEITNGPGTDIRLSHPACILFEKKV